MLDNSLTRFKLGKAASAPKSKTAGFRRGVALFMLLGLVAFAFYTPISSSSVFNSASKLNTSSSPVADKQVKSLLAQPFSAWKPAALFALVQPDTIVVSPPATRQAGCNDPQVLCLGEEVSATVSDVPLRAGFRERRIQWIAPDGTVPQMTDVITDPQTDTYTLPIAGSFAQVGKWTVRTINNRGGGAAVASFEVIAPALPSVDLQLSMTGPALVTANNNATYTVTVTNLGPDVAVDVRLFNPVPYNTTFVSAVAPGGFVCTTPIVGQSGDIDCTGVGLAAETSAIFTFTFLVNGDVQNGASVFNAASVDSATNEPNTDNNVAFSDSQSAPPTGGGGDCTLDCPDSITANANTTEAGQRGAHVNYDDPIPDGDCGVVTSTPASGSFFPVGTTTVTATSSLNGGSCSFTVTVEDQGEDPPTISCPSNKEANADSNCAAVVAVGTATATGNNVTVTGTRSDGRPMYTCDVNGTNCVRRSSDDPFQAGTTTITWTAYSHNAPGPYADADDEEARRTGSASCTQTVIVRDVTAPVITPPPGQTASADASCMAPVPDFTTSATVADNCACASSDTSEICDEREDIVVTQDPAPGTLVGLGTHTITLTASDQADPPNTSTATTTFTVNDTTAPAITCPDNVTANTTPGACSAVVNPGAATATDNCDSNPTITATRSDGQPLVATYPKGTTTITWRATDDSGNYSECTQTVTVVDNEPPTFTFTATQSMWPPNHKYKTFTTANLIASVQDNCGSLPVSSVLITKVTSDEIENGNGDGNTMNDIVIAANCKSVELRSEREGGGNGRVYTIFFRVTDASGNIGVGSTKVVVPHNNGSTAVDSGPHYTVMSNCP